MLPAFLLAGVETSSLLILFCDEIDGCGAIYGGGSVLAAAGLGMICALAWMFFFFNQEARRRPIWLATITMFMLVILITLVMKGDAQAAAHGMGFVGGLIRGIWLSAWSIWSQFYVILLLTRDQQRYIPTIAKLVKNTLSIFTTCERGGQQDDTGATKYQL